MEMARPSTEFPSDYIDIVNEINDFIASLDAPPLDNHTKELVGNSQRQNTFGQLGDDGVPEVWTSGSRSRHASGDKNIAGQMSLVKTQGDIEIEELSDKTAPFPLLEESDQGMNTYDYIGSDKSRSTDFGDYSDLSIASDNADSDNADSDSGCYSHYQHPRSNIAPFNREPSATQLAASCPSNFPSYLPSPSHSGPGQLKGSAYLTSSPQHQQQFLFSSTHPQSPDRLSAEFRCDPHRDTIDHSFNQVGSSAHSLAASLGLKGWTPAENHYQEPSNIPKVPESPVPQRKSPTKSSIPLSTSPLPAQASAIKHDPSQDAYSVINKTSPSRLNIRNRWPPASATDGLSPHSSFPLKPDSNAAKNIDIVPISDKSLDAGFEGHACKEEDPAASQQHPIPIPITRVPDLSVLISELRSASPRSDMSPNSKFTASARSESAYPSPKTKSEDQSHPRQARAESQSPIHSSGQGHLSRVDKHNDQGHSKARAETLSPGHPPRTAAHTTVHSPWSEGPVGLQEARSPAHKQLSNGGRCKSNSPEHDYEPIENLQLEVPATPRPQTKFPHPQGQTTMAETGGQQPKHVKALHSFKGTNNDELCFKKGDIITVTQCLDGGWWEGTLNGRTGWFPNNFTKEIKADVSYKNKTGEVPVYKRESMQLYHNVVLKNVIETEKTHVTEMIKVLQSYIKPIEQTSILTPPEYTLLIGNLEEIIAFQQSFLAALEECEKLPSHQRRIGGIFMQFAPSIKPLYLSYCANHPKAVSVLQTKRSDLGKFVESQGAPPPGAQTLITILSKPFTRLDKYPSLLKELERHVEESHPDRGDTQRAIAVYRNINNACLEIRKLKEMEHEIISSTIQGWEGEEISKLGEVVHLSQVKMVTQTGEKYERIFVLFSSCLVMLSMSQRLSSYQYEGKIPLSGLTSTACENTDLYQNAFEISGPMIEKITVLCGTKSEVTTWLDILNQQLSLSGVTSSKPQSLQVLMVKLTGLPVYISQPSVSTVTPAKTALISSNPPTAPPPQFPPSAKPSSVWSLTCLRPSPPTRPTLMCREEVLKSPRAARKTTNKRKPEGSLYFLVAKYYDPKVYNEDAFILQVIEAYCNSVKTRHTVNSCRIEGAKKKPNDGKAILNSPQILLAEEEKIFDETEQQERTVVDTVYALQDRVKELEQEQRKLRQDLDEEKRCRKKLEALVRQQYIKSAVVDGIQDGSS
ncbi:unnamed protein product [Lymnaea stagnalis]|uniref:Rho guanine nucleotide exchange factor 7 n=1 Tax=Lymnaea stagnalis TaxID=6523 RepID=A0AAV2HNT5_LYMST